MFIYLNPQNTWAIFKFENMFKETFYYAAKYLGLGNGSNRLDPSNWHFYEPRRRAKSSFNVLKDAGIISEEDILIELEKLKEKGVI